MQDNTNTKTFWVDYSASIKVEAENEDDAIIKACQIINGECIEVNHVEKIEN